MNHLFLNRFICECKFTHSTVFKRTTIFTKSREMTKTFRFISVPKENNKISMLFIAYLYVNIFECDLQWNIKIRTNIKQWKIIKSTSFVIFASIDNDHKITIWQIYAEELIISINVKPSHSTGRLIQSKISCHHVNSFKRRSM